MEFYYAFKARDNLKGLPALIQKRIAKKMRFYAAQQDPLKFAERLTDSRESKFRFRVGDHRIFFDVVKNRIIILMSHIVYFVRRGVHISSPASVSAINNTAS